MVAGTLTPTRRGWKVAVADSKLVRYIADCFGIEEAAEAIGYAHKLHQLVTFDVAEGPKGLTAEEAINYINAQEI